MRAQLYINTTSQFFAIVRLCRHSMMQCIIAAITLFTYNT